MRPPKQAAPVTSEASTAEPKRKAKATAKATAAKSQPKKNAKGKAAAIEAAEKARGDKDKNQFQFRLTRAPQSVKDDWAAVKPLSKDDPKRQRLFELIKSVKAGDYKQCEMTLIEEVDRSTGIIDCEGRSCVCPTVHLHTRINNHNPKYPTHVFQGKGIWNMCKGVPVLHSQRKLSTIEIRFLNNPCVCNMKAQY